MRKILVSLLFCMPFLAVAQTFTADKVVAVVGNSAIFYSEVYQTRQQLEATQKQQGVSSDRDPMSEALENLLLQKLLYQQALVDSLVINESNLERVVEDRLGSMIKEAGSTNALEKSLNLPLYNIREDLKGKYREMFLAQQMQQSIRSKVTIRPAEVEKYFKGMDKSKLPIIPEQYEYAQLTLSPPSTEEAKIRVREQLLEMRKRIIAGEKFSLLARMYSVDGSARRGGEMDPTPKEGFVAPFSDAMVKLKIGQVSEVVETEFGFHLIEVLAKSDNLYTCRHILLRPTYSTDELMEGDKILDSMVVKIKAGDISFEQAASEVSDDKYSKTNGGLVSNLEMLEMYGAYDPKLATTRFLREELQPADYRVLQNMKVGDISNAFQTEDLRGNTRSKVIKLVDIVPSHKANVEDDYLRIETMALAEKQNAALETWIDQKIRNIYFRINDEFKNADFMNKAWLK